MTPLSFPGITVNATIYEKEYLSFPEDAEESDRVYIREMIENYFNTMYPDFEPEIVGTLEKQYYLPALKVLKVVDGRYYSPGYVAEWVDGELRAECRTHSLPGGFWLNGEEVEIKHKAPHPHCDCGIYGSVNLEEISGYNRKNFYNPYIHERFDLALCIIEPSEGAEVILCRKGWKASRAFISEIVGETISIEEASGLLSTAWNRSIDVRKAYENR